MILSGDKFKKARGETPISVIQMKMMNVLGRPVSYYTIRNWELGKCDPHEDLFKAFCQVTGKPAKYFIE